MNDFTFVAPAWAPGNYAYNFAGVNAYSDLDIKEWDITLDSDYQINNYLSANVGVTALYYKDDNYRALESNGRDQGTGQAYIGMLSLIYRR